MKRTMYIPDRIRVCASIPKRRTAAKIRKYLDASGNSEQRPLSLRQGKETKQKIRIDVPIYLVPLDTFTLSFYLQRAAGSPPVPFLGSTPRTRSDATSVLSVSSLMIPQTSL
jgi:hypothetical protein